MYNLLLGMGDAAGQLLSRLSLGAAKSVGLVLLDLIAAAAFSQLFLAAALSGLQGAFWGNFGPISGAVIPYYGWDDGTIAWLNNWGPIAFLLVAAPSAWLKELCDIVNEVVRTAAASHLSWYTPTSARIARVKPS